MPTYPKHHKKPHKKHFLNLTTVASLLRIRMTVGIPRVTKGKVKKSKYEVIIPNIIKNQGIICFSSKKVWYFSSRHIAISMIYVQGEY
jgi:hypothetical protein